MTTGTVSGTPVEGWYTGAVTVTLTAADEAGGSGVASTEYQLDDATTWTAYTAPVPVTGDGTHEVRFRSTDTAGNVEATKKVTVKIDATAPVTTATFAPANDDGWHNGTVPVVLTATDAGSGVKKLEWSLDGGAWTPYTAPVDVTGDGQHELLYRATDTAGNVETLKSAVVRRSTAPSRPCWSPGWPTASSTATARTSGSRGRRSTRPPASSPRPAR